MSFQYFEIYLNKYFKIILGTAAIAYIALMLYVTLSRIAYPFELEWMEGGSVEQLDLIMQSKQIYTPPSINYIPYIYTPMYYWASIPFAKVFGIGLFPMRLVSFLSTLGCLLLTFLIINQLTKDKLLSLTGAGLFAATFNIGGAWFDLARVDMLFMLFYLFAVFILISNRDTKWLLISSLIAFCGFLTKQSAMFLFFPVSVYLLIYERKKSWYFNIPFWSLLILSTVYFSMSSDGWYYFWNFTLPADHRWTKKVFILFWTFDIIRPLGVSLAFIIMIFLTKKWKENKNNLLLYLSIIIGAVICSYSSRLHYGGYANVLIPIYAILSIFMPLGVKYVLGMFSEESNKIIHILVYTLLIFQFITLLYSPGKMIPTKADEKAGWELVNTIKSFKGDVYVPGNIYFSRVAGKKQFSHGLLLWDLMQSTTKYSKSIEKELIQALESGRFDAIISYNQMESNYPKFTEYYYPARKVQTDESLLWAKTGFTTRPEFIYLPKIKN